MPHQLIIRLKGGSNIFSVKNTVSCVILATLKYEIARLMLTNFSVDVSCSLLKDYTRINDPPLFYML